MTRYQRPCPDECEHCEGLGENAAEDRGEPDDWQTGQTRYERQLDAPWGDA